MKVLPIAGVVILFLLVPALAAQADTRNKTSSAAVLFSPSNQLTSGEETIQPIGSYINLNGGDEYQCYNTLVPFCRCMGENSTDCDELFADCDAVGGIFTCASDLGLESDACDCEL